jgi:hypothetical protein
MWSSWVSIETTLKTAWLSNHFPAVETNFSLLYSIQSRSAVKIASRPERTGSSAHKSIYCLNSPITVGQLLAIQFPRYLRCGVTQCYTFQKHWSAWLQGLLFECLPNLWRFNYKQKISYIAMRLDYIHTYIHTYVHTYIRTYVHTYIPKTLCSR